MAYISRGRSRGDNIYRGDATKTSSPRIPANFNKAKEALVTLKGGGLRKQQQSPTVLETYGKAIKTNNPGSLLNQTLNNAKTTITCTNQNSSREDHRTNRKRKLLAFYNAGGKFPRVHEAFTNNAERPMTLNEVLQYAKEITKHGQGDERDVKYLKGRGLISADPNFKEILGNQGPNSNLDISNTPQIEGERRLGGVQPGFEKFIFQPTVKVSDFIETINELKIGSNPLNPQFAEVIYLTIPQQAPGFMDTTTAHFEFYIQLYNGDAVIANNLEAQLVGSNHTTFINNLGPSLFKNIGVSINNQQIELGPTNYAFQDLFETLWYTEQQKYEKGDLEDQLYIWEPIGELNNAFTTAARGGDDPQPARSTNPKNLFFFKTLLQGQKMFVRFRPKAPFIKASMAKSLANRIEFTLTRNPNNFLIYVDQNLDNYPGANANEKTAARAAAMTLASNFKIAITDFKIRFNRLELVPHELERYIQSYTMENPDTFYFTHHHIKVIAINPNAQVIREQLQYDSIPDLIVVTMVDKAGIVGTYGTYSITTYPIPETDDKTGYEVNVNVNNQKWRSDLLDKNSEAYHRLNQALYSKFNNPLLPRGAIDTDTVTGYHMYPFTLTNTSKGTDGRMYEDRRNGAIELYCELTPGATWPANYTWMVHAFTRRNFSIDTEGQITKNFL